MAKPFAYVCAACKHLASRHELAGSNVVAGPYVCTYDGCDCEISQTAPLYGIDEATFNRVDLTAYAT